MRVSCGLVGLAVKVTAARAGHVTGTVTLAAKTRVRLGKACVWVARMGG